MESAPSVEANGTGAPTGILLVDKPAGITSHGVVARVRRSLGTRKVGHAGTLDPMATGLLVLGVGPATRLLTFIVGADKTYETTIRLGRSSSTDDAEGELGPLATDDVLAAANDAAIESGVTALTGTILQRPSAVSAIKVDGKRAYARVRDGEEVDLPEREVVVRRFEVLGIRRHDNGVDVTAVVDCSSGTYIRALARDLGSALGVGGHLTALRRTRVGPFDVAEAVDLDDVGDSAVRSPAQAAARLFPVAHLPDEAARDLAHGKRIVVAAPDGEPVAAIDPSGRLVGLVSVRAGLARVIANFPDAAVAPADTPRSGS